MDLSALDGGDDAVVLRCRGPTEPVFETNLTESRVIARNECALAQFGAEVACLRIREALASAHGAPR